MTDIVTWARTQIGVTETPAGSNMNPYGKILGRNGEAWCEGYVVVGGIQDGYDARWHCDNVMFTPEYLKDLRAVGFGVDIRKAKLGASVSFHMAGGRAGTNHAGIFVELFVSKGITYVVTIDGNTSPTEKGSQYNGGCVAEKTRPLSTVTGCVQPPLASLKAPPATVAAANATLAELQQVIFFARQIGLGRPGDANPADAVKILQTGLNRWADRFAFMAGRPNPPDIPVDGQWNPTTWDAVTAVQQLTGRKDSGAYGTLDPNGPTWSSLFP